VTSFGSNRDGLTTQISQHVFNHHEDQHFVLDDEYAPTGKQFIRDEQPSGRGNSSCRPTPRVCSQAELSRPVRMQPTREAAIGDDFRDADFRIAKGYQWGLENGERFGKLVWSEVDHEFR
jgi:hypothetical protein